MLSCDQLTFIFAVVLTSNCLEDEYVTAENSTTVQNSFQDFRPMINSTVISDMQELVNSMTRRLEQAGYLAPVKQTRKHSHSGSGGILGLMEKLQGLRFLLDALSPGAAAAPPPPSIPSLVALLALSGGGLNPLLGGHGGGSSDDASNLAIHFDQRNCSQNLPTSAICDLNAAVKTLIALPHTVWAIGQQGSYEIALNGTPGERILDEQLSALSDLPTAAIGINGSHFLFYGQKVALLNLTTGKPGPKIPIGDLFYGVKQAIRGALRYNDHTLALFFDIHFVFYQPMANPPVDPRFSPQPISAIPNGPSQIDSALEINGKKYRNYAPPGYLYRKGWLYQLATGGMAVVQEIPLKSYNGSDAGWIQCVNFVPC